MQVEQLEAQGLSRQFKVTLGAGDIQTRIDAKLNEIQGQVQIKGFRPGKVPLAHLKRTFGKSVLGEVVESAVGESSDAAIRSAELRPATQPKIEITKFEEGGDLVFTMSVDIMPEIPAVDTKSIKLERMVAEVTEEEIDKAVENLLKTNRSFEPKDGEAQSGDVAVIDYVGKIDGKVFDGGSAEGHALELGSGQFLAGFEDQLIGAKAGDTREVNVAFPENYGVAELSGKPAVFDVTVTEVRAPAEAKADDAFAKRFNFETIEALREAVKAQVQSEFNRATRARLKRLLLDALDGKVDFPLPPTLVEAEFEQIWKQLEDTKARSKEAGEAEETPEEVEKEKAEFRKIAERRVRLGLLLAEIGRLNNITVSQDELNRAVMDEARRYPGQERQVFEFYNKQPQAVAELRAPIFEEKVVDFLLELAELTDKVVSRDELFKEPDEDELLA